MTRCTLLIILLTLSLNSSESQARDLPPQLVFDFKGYKVELHDFTQGNHEQYLFVGTIDFLEAYEGEQGSIIRNLFEFIHRISSKTLVPFYFQNTFNRFIRLSDGFTLVIAPDKEKNWCYYLYNKSMKLKKTKTSTVSTNYQIQKFREGEKGRIHCLFRPDSSKKSKSIPESIKIN